MDKSFRLVIFYQNIVKRNVLCKTQTVTFINHHFFIQWKLKNKDERGKFPSNAGMLAISKSGNLSKHDINNNAVKGLLKFYLKKSNKILIYLILICNFKIIIKQFFIL